jgi:hypothetical protein
MPTPMRPKGIPILVCNCANPPWPLFVKHRGNALVRDAPDLSHAEWHVLNFRVAVCTSDGYHQGDKDAGLAREMRLSEELTRDEIFAFIGYGKVEYDCAESISGICPQCRKVFKIRFRQPVPKNEASILGMLLNAPDQIEDITPHIRIVTQT